MKISKDSLQARINNLSKQKGVPSNTILQNYFFDAFLKRLEKTKYVNNFIFKGGFLLATTLGVDYRSTLDIDFLLHKLALTKENVEKIFKEIAKYNVGDGITFDYKGIENIRLDDEYGGYNVTLLGHLDNIKVTVKVDVATGDPITPNSIDYEYKCLFDDKPLSFKAYNLETIIAEKVQTILKRGITNSRCKDFYDVYIIRNLKWDGINKGHLKEAYKNTCNYRQTIYSKDEALKIIKEIMGDNKMITRWQAYKKKNSFATEVNFDDTINALVACVETIY